MNMNNRLKVACFGEVLWDHFPTYSKIGGAPLNVALRLKSLGAEVTLLSAIGNDQYGNQIQELLENSNIDTTELIKVSFNTGAVNVSLNEKGDASYDIVHPSAWDKIDYNDKTAEKIANCDVFVFGSLSTRDEHSRNSLKNYLMKAQYKVFDVNLRAPHYTYEGIRDLMNYADMIKLNDDELFEVSWQLGSKFNSFKQNIEYLAKLTNTNTICVTKGAFGAVLYQNGNFYNHNGFRVKVIDTVGSGDSFLAGMIYTLFTSHDPKKAIEIGCAIGALVANSEGGNPKIESKQLEAFINPI
jgi:fructokinase